jgi:hypothetical protein
MVKDVSLTQLESYTETYQLLAKFQRGNYPNLAFKLHPPDKSLVEKNFDSFLFDVRKKFKSNEFSGLLLLLLLSSSLLLFVLFIM